MDSEKLAKLVEASIGENDKQQQVEHFLDTGFPPLNKACSGDYEGGFPVGVLIEMFGPPSCGKTAIATQVMAAAQREGGIAMFMDHESSFDIGLGRSLGLDDSPGLWIYKQPETFEESIDMVVVLAHAIRDAGAIDKDAPIVVVFDSLASMVPQSKLFDKKTGERRGSDSYNMHDNTALARATSAVFSVLKPTAKKLNMMCLFLNQVRQKPGVAYGNPDTTPGGNAPEYYTDTRIKLKRELIKDKATKQFLGQTITAECVKSKVTLPFKTARWNFMINEAGEGYFDAITSSLEELKKLGRLKTAGAYIVWTDGKKYYISALAKKIKEEGSQDELFAMFTGDKK